jgi:hypothetical protein
MSEQGVSRRNVLKLGAGAVAASGVASLAGCSAFGGGGGGSGKVAKYAFEPGEITEADHYQVSYQNVPAYVNNEDAFSSDAWDQYEESFETRYDDTLGIDIDDAKWHVRLGSVVRVLRANYDSDDVAGELEDQEYDDDEGEKGYTLWTRENGSRGYATDGSTVISARRANEESPEDVLETVIGVLTGDTNKYKKESDSFGTVQSKVGSGDSVSFSTADPDSETSFFDNVVGSGSSGKLKGDTTKVTIAFVFEEGDDVPDKDDRGEFAEDFLEDQADYDDVSHSKSGRAAKFTGERDTDEISLGGF